MTVTAVATADSLPTCTDCGAVVLPAAQAHHELYHAEHRALVEVVNALAQAFGAATGTRITPLDTSKEGTQ